MSSFCIDDLTALFSRTAVNVMYSTAILVTATLSMNYSDADADAGMDTDTDTDTDGFERFLVSVPVLASARVENPEEKMVLEIIFVLDR